MQRFLIGLGRPARKFCCVYFGAAATVASVAAVLHQPMHPNNDIVFSDLLAHNLTVLAIIGVGVIVGTWWTGAVLMLNGAMFGAAVGAAWTSGAWGSLASGVLPHFIPEVSAFILGSAAVSRFRAGRKLRAGISQCESGANNGFMALFTVNFLCIVLLTVAAIIETYVSRV